MGFYLPGIGEAIGGALRVQRQEELWNKAQGILKDESKPMAERLQMVGVAYPELSNTEDFKERITQARLFDQDKREAAKFEQEQERAATVENFKGVISELDPQARLDVLRKNPDLAALAVPEEWKVLKAADKSQQERSQWLEGEAGKDRRAAVAAGAQSSRDTLNRYLAGQMDAQGNLISPAQQAATKQAQVLSTAGAKAEQAAGMAAQAKTAALDDLTAGLTEYRDILSSEGRTGGFGADAAELESLRMSLGVKLAQADNPGRAPTDADVKVAMERIPETGFMTSPTNAIAQVDRLIKDAKGFKAGQSDKPAKKGFTPAAGSVR